MGMAASQARFLTLTARKSNTEYQGQQVNQQRTALANESANIYSKLANMDVPTAPSKTSFNRDMYSFKGANNEKYEITNLRSLSEVKDSNGNPTGSYTGVATISFDEYTEIVDQGTTLGDFTRTSNGLISITGTSTYYKEQECRKDNTENTTGTTAEKIDNTKVAINQKIIEKYARDNGLNVSELKPEDFTYLRPVDKDGKDSAGAGYFMYTKDLEDGASSSKKLKYAMSSTTTPSTKDVDITITKNEQGRYTNIALANGHGLNISGNDANLSYEYGTDEEGYEKAMADYEYKKAQYDKEVDVLNNKTEVIQNQDKRLELKLKQLDTERNALNTEMEAVKGYLKKNVEGTFNTFG